MNIVVPVAEERVQASIAIGIAQPSETNTRQGMDTIRCSLAGGVGWDDAER